MENYKMYSGWVNFFFKGHLASSFHSRLCRRKRPWLCLEWGWPCSLPWEPSLCPLIERIVDSWYKVRQSEFCQVTPVVHEVLQQQEWWLNRAVKFFQEFELGNSPKINQYHEMHQMNTEWTQKSSWREQPGHACGEQYRDEGPPLGLVRPVPIWHFTHCCQMLLWCVSLLIATGMPQ